MPNALHIIKWFEAIRVIHSPAAGFHLPKSIVVSRSLWALHNSAGYLNLRASYTLCLQLLRLHQADVRHASCRSSNMWKIKLAHITSMCRRRKSRQVYQLECGLKVVWKVWGLSRGHLHACWGPSTLGGHLHLPRGLHWDPQSERQHCHQSIMSFSFLLLYSLILEPLFVCSSLYILAFLYCYIVLKEDLTA